MAKLIKMDKPNALLVRSLIAKALAPIEAELGVKISLGNAKFDSTMVRFANVEVRVQSDAVAALTEDRIKSRLVLCGLASRDHQVLENVLYKIIDFRDKAPKRPWVVMDKRDGKTYVLTTDQVSRSIPQAAVR